MAKHATNPEALEDTPEDKLYKEEKEAAAEGFSSLKERRSSRRTRVLLKIIIVCVVILIITTGTIGMTFIMQNSQQTAQSAENRSTSTDAGEGSDTSDPTESTTEVPDLVSAIGLSRQDAIEVLGHGAQETAETSIDEEGSFVCTIVTVELSDEPTDARTGTPTVYLSLDENETVVGLSYAAGLAQLGYASMSFTDAVTEACVVEETLRAAGVDVADEQVVLPDDSSEYTQYGDDGSIRSERYSFTGTLASEGGYFEWTVLLVYEYSSSSTSSSVSDVTRRLTLSLVWVSEE